MTDLHESTLLEDLADQRKHITVRQLLRAFGAERRGYRVVADIRHDLDARGLVTEPDFDSVHIDAPIYIQRGTRSETPSPDLLGTVADDEISDPVTRVGRLVDTNRPLVAVSPGTTLVEASTIMMMRDFSQLPVLRTDYDCIGMVSWRSMGRAAALGRRCSQVQECVEPVPIIEADAPLFDAMQQLRSVDVILMRSADGKISGILTTADISVQFHLLGEPFLLIGEIENHIRVLLDTFLDPAQLASGRDPGEAGRDVSSAADLSFGEYRRILEHPDAWSRVGLPVDRGAFIRELEAIRQLRNDVMHFDPDGIAPENLRRVREFSEFVRSIVKERLRGAR